MNNLRGLSISQLLLVGLCMAFIVFEIGAILNAQQTESPRPCWNFNNQGTRDNPHRHLHCLCERGCYLDCRNECSDDYYCETKCHIGAYTVVPGGMAPGLIYCANLEEDTEDDAYVYSSESCEECPGCDSPLDGSNCGAECMKRRCTVSRSSTSHKGWQQEPAKIDFELGGKALRNKFKFTLTIPLGATFYASTTNGTSVSTELDCQCLDQAEFGSGRVECKVFRVIKEVQWLTKVNVTKTMKCKNDVLFWPDSVCCEKSCSQDQNDDKNYVWQTEFDFQCMVWPVRFIPCDAPEHPISLPHPPIRPSIDL